MCPVWRQRGATTAPLEPIMARPRTVSDAAILEAARSVFLELGPAASTAVIADRVGLSQAGLFKRFPRKADLMVAALAPPDIPPFAVLLAQGPDVSQPVKPQLKVIARAVAVFFKELVPCVMVLNASGLSPEDLMNRYDVPPPLMATRAMSSWLDQAVDAGALKSRDTMATAFAFLGAMHMRCFLAHISDATETDEALAAYADSVVDNLWDGLAPSEETP